MKYCAIPKKVYFDEKPSLDDIYHHGILGMKWGKRNGPPYPLGASDHSASEKKAGYKKSIGGGTNENLYERDKNRHDKNNHTKAFVKKIHDNMEVKKTTFRFPEGDVFTVRGKADSELVNKAKDKGAEITYEYRKDKNNPAKAVAKKPSYFERKRIEKEEKKQAKIQERQEIEEYRQRLLDAGWDKEYLDKYWDDYRIKKAIEYKKIEEKYKKESDALNKAEDALEKFHSKRRPDLVKKAKEMAKKDGLKETDPNFDYFVFGDTPSENYYQLAEYEDPTYKKLNENYANALKDWYDVQAKYKADNKGK